MTTKVEERERIEEYSVLSGDQLLLRLEEVEGRRSYRRHGQRTMMNGTNPVTTRLRSGTNVATPGTACTPRCRV